MNDTTRRRRRQVVLAAAAAVAITVQHATLLMSLDPDCLEDSDDDKSDSAILEETGDDLDNDSSVIILSTAERHSQRATTEPSFPVAMHGLQSSLNRLNDVLNEAFKSENQTAPQDVARMELTQAVKLLEERATTEPSFPVAMHGLQSSLNRLNDVLNEVFKSENQIAPQDVERMELTQAVQLLEERGDGLSQKEQLNMMTLFMENPAVVSTYLGIEEDGPRRAWVKSVLLDVNALPSR